MTPPGPGTAPQRGDLIWVNFHPQAGHEQAGRRPALVLTAERFNRATGLLLAVPVTSKVKGYPLEYPLPGGLSIGGVLLVHQCRMLNWRARNAEVIEPVPTETVQAIRDMLAALLEDE